MYKNCYTMETMPSKKKNTKWLYQRVSKISSAVNSIYWQRRHEQGHRKYATASEVVYRIWWSQTTASLELAGDTCFSWLRNLTSHGEQFVQVSSVQIHPEAWTLNHSVEDRLVKELSATQNTLEVSKNVLNFRKPGLSCWYWIHMA